MTNFRKLPQQQQEIILLNGSIKKPRGEQKAKKEDQSEDPGVQEVRETRRQREMRLKVFWSTGELSENKQQG
jgi:hypothetical protein